MSTDTPEPPNTLFVDVRQRPPDGVRPRPGLILDRDGVIVELVGFLHRPEDVRLIDGVGPVIASFNRAGVPVVVATNQSGIGRGLFGWRDFERTQAEVDRQLAAEGGAIDAVAACPCHPEAEAPYRHPDHPHRKPNAGMLRELARVACLDLARSWLVGDHLSDVEAAGRAGLRGAVHVMTGHGAGHRPTVRALASTRRRVWLAESLTEIGARLLRLYDAGGDRPG